jgi:hypothetical protein
MAAGRPSEYNLELCKEICNEVAEGKNVIATLKSNNKYPSWSTFRRWKNENSELQTLYTRGIQDKAEMVDFEIDSIMADVKSKAIDTYVGRLLIDTLKWKAAKYYPKMFGDSSKVVHEGGINVTNKQEYSDFSTEDLKAIEEISKKYEKKRD